jgi:hypothetical protein
VRRVDRRPMEVFLLLNDGGRDRRKSEFEETTRNVSFGLGCVDGGTRRSSRFWRVGSFQPVPERLANALLNSRRASTLKSTPYFSSTLPKNYT